MILWKSKILNLRSVLTSLFRGQRRGRLVRHYFFASVLMIAGGLTASGVLEAYFRYQESREQLGLLQQESAKVAALEIEQFIHDIETAMRAATKYQDIVRQGISAEYEFELRRLLYLVPAITEAVAIDAGGIAQAHLSRSRAVSSDPTKNFAASPAFQQVRRGHSYLGPLYFVRESEPYVTIALPIERFARSVAGVLQAEVNLKYVWQVVSGIKQGKAGYAYVVNRSGDLIAHPDISLVLQKRNLAQLSQVKAAFVPAGRVREKWIISANLKGEKVISSFAIIPSLDWAVLIERPVEEAYEPLYASMVRTSTLLLISLGVALLASFFVARRVLRPLRVLGQGVERIGSGDLSFRVDLKTGDEMERLADEFNEMAAHLKEAYTGLERKVVERTQALMIANEKLAEASKLKSQFLANVNHELRTPMSAILGYAHLLRRETEGQITPQQRENLRDLLNNAERLLAQIDGLLDFAKIEAGKMELKVEPVKVDELIQSAASTVELNLSNGGVRLIREIAPAIPVLKTDREKLRQIILNLLDNAAKFTEHGEIKIAACQRNESLQLMVSDTGIGIDKEDLSRIFEEFHRGDSSNMRKYRGTGLGLAIAKRFVNLLGGEISVESEVGKGSTFTVRLPLDLRESGSQ